MRGYYSVNAVEAFPPIHAYTACYSRLKILKVNVPMHNNNDNETFLQVILRV